MKIFEIVTLSDLGGAQSVLITLCNNLVKEDHEIIVISEFDGPMWNLLSDKIKQIRLKSFQRSLNLFKDIMVIIKLKRLYSIHKPDIIHLHSSKAGVLGRIAFPSSKIVYTVHGFDSIRLAYRKYLPVERLLQNSCRAIIGVSIYDKNNLLSENISTNVTCVYNGIDKPVALQAKPFSSLMDLYKRKILCIARLSPQKNNALFLQIALRLPNYAFIWIGNQHEINEAVPSNVFFMGNIINAGAYNEYIDLFILPTNYEGLPIVLLEAMSYGKPIVASNVGGISEIVTDGENGYTVANTPEAFMEKIEHILENETIISEFSQKAIERFNKEFKSDKMLENYMKIFKSIITSK